MKKHFLSFSIIFIGISFFLAKPRTSYQPIQDKSLKYNETCQILAHNSYLSLRAGYNSVAAEHEWTISEMLRNGVRGLELDTWPVRGKGKWLKKKVRIPFTRKYKYVPYKYLNPNDTVIRKYKESLKSFYKRSKITLNHGAPKKGIYVQLKAGHTPKFPPYKLKTALKEIKTFLVNNPEEIITIYIENHCHKINSRKKEVSDKEITSYILEKSGISNMVLTPSDWNLTQKGEWPTLQWMIDNNKRLVILNECRGYSQTAKRVNNAHGPQKIQDFTLKFGTTGTKSTAKFYVDTKRKTLRTTPRNASLFIISLFPGNAGGERLYKNINSNLLGQLIQKIFDDGLELQKIVN